jgi:hypothetical protein
MDYTVVISPGHILHNTFLLKKPFVYNKCEYKSVEHFFHCLQFSYSEARVKEQRFCDLIRKQDTVQGVQDLIAVKLILIGIILN